MIKLLLLLVVLTSSCRYSDSYKRDQACTQMKCMKGMVGISYDVDGCGCAIVVR